MTTHEAPWGIKTADGFPVDDRVWLALSQLDARDREPIETALSSPERLTDLSRGGVVAGDKGQFRVAAITPAFRLVFRPAGRVIRVTDLLHQGVFDAMGVDLRPASSEKVNGAP